MPIIDDYDASAKRMRELELPGQEQSREDAELEKWRDAGADERRHLIALLTDRRS